MVGIWPGHRGYTTTLYEKCHGIFNDHRKSRPRFNFSADRQCFLTEYCPRHYTGVLGPTQTTGWAPPAGLTNTSSSSNLVFPGGLPSRNWPAQPCLASVGNRSWAAGWYGFGNTALGTALARCAMMIETNRLKAGTAAKGATTTCWLKRVCVFMKVFVYSVTFYCFVLVSHTMSFMLCVSVRHLPLFFI